MPPVVLVNMPFANLRWPNLGPSLLKAALLQRGIPCEIAYFNFDFAERVGYERYQWLADCFAFVLGGEWLFAQEFFGKDIPPPEAYFAELRRRKPDQFGSEEEAELRSAAAEVSGFLRHCLAAIDWSTVKIAGFSVCFQQTLASLCLARLLKAAYPHIQTVFGGAACEAEMGVALWECFPEIDYVFLGEADLTFGPFVEQLLEGRLTTLPPGVIGQIPTGDKTQNSGPREHHGLRQVPDSGCEDVDLSVVLQLDELPYPDFDDYFRRLQKSLLAGEIRPFLFFESSRGCWWGEKHHCKFCGLNGSRLTFRSKSPERVVDEVVYLVNRYGVNRLCAADNIFDYRYFDSLLPLLRKQKLDVKFVYELKCNLKRVQVEELVASGLGAAQLGIETFSTPILRLANKGATGLQNLQTLKWFSEHPVEVEWNFLYGFPGEPPEEYAWLAKLIPALVHLAPPLAIGRVRMDRFSPYFADPGAYGLVNQRPLWALRYVYPFCEDVLRRLAYYFDFDFADGRNPDDYGAPAIEAARYWQDLKGQVTFRAFDRGDGVLVLTDTRPVARQFQRRLTGWERELYLFCDQGRTLRDIVSFVSSVHPEPDLSSIRETLANWQDERLITCIDEHYLSLATWAR
ncbi:MAG: RiPP maturation radical SAM C-methyltransferase [Thermoguttaceae bacterium]|nr:RiPP maturation radical SAM C-methyltransferase [Thermoguttaceae bacterium]MDW8079777.1 RiPP maturation radical SAM C-methyltransferase [Thermoguttaceae bacterium]